MTKFFARLWHRLVAPNYFKDVNERSRIEVVSPSGKFKLLIRYYNTGPDTWNYSRCTVYRVSDRKQVVDFKFNYSPFDYGFLTQSGIECLAMDRHYIKQLIVNLNTGEEMVV